MKKSVQARRTRKLTEAQERSFQKLERLAEIHKVSKHIWEKEIDGLDEDDLQLLERKLDRLQQAFMLAKNPSPSGAMVEGEKPVNPLRHVCRDVRSLQGTFWFVWKHNFYVCLEGGPDAREGMEITAKVLRLLNGL